MRTRAERLAYDHVGALNLIELEFYRNKSVIVAYKDYLSTLREPSSSPEQERHIIERRNSSYHELLYQLGRAVGLSYDKAELQEHTYSPQGWANDQQVQRLNGQLLNELLSGKRTFPITAKIEDQ